MFNDKIIYSEEKSTSYPKLLMVIIFLVGFLNGKPYFDFMGYSLFSQFLLLILYLLTLTMLFITIVNIAFKKNNSIQTSHYWIILFFAFLIKYFLLFVQFPETFLPGEENFYPMLTNFMNVLLIFIIMYNIKSMREMKLSIWTFGIGAILSLAFAILFYSEYIGIRITEINGYNFSGGIWNQPLISYMSVGWLLMFLTIYEKKTVLKTIAFLMFVTLALGGMFGLSRALFISILISILIYIVISNNLRKYLKSIIIVTLLMVISSFLFSNVIDNFSERIDEGINIEEESRVNIWTDYIKNIPDYFWFGEIEGNYKKYSSSAKEFGPHSVILNWFVQFGIIGLVGFLYLMYGILKSFKIVYRLQSKEYGAIIMAWFVAYIAIAAINETGFDQTSIFVGIGTILAWGNIANNNK